MELTLTIPKTSISEKRSQFVAIPYKEYKLFLRLKEIFSASVHLTASQKKRITKSEHELAQGEYSTLDVLENELLGSTRSKTDRKTYSKIAARG